MSSLSNKLTISTIKPASADACYAVIEQRKASKDAEDKPNGYVLFALPAELDAIMNPVVKAFCANAYESYVRKYGSIALKAGHSEFPMPSLAELSQPKKREFSFTKALVQDWLDNFAFAIINEAIASKMNQGINAASVVKKALKYSALFAGMAGGAIMPQADIEACASALALMENAVASGSIQAHAFTEQVIARLGKKQDDLTAFLEAQALGAEEESDF